MFLGQRDKAKEAAVKSNIHNIQVGIQTYAVDNNDTYPAATEVASTGAVGNLVNPWPKNPWDNKLMTAGTGKGQYSYTLGSGTFLLTGYGKTAGTAIITVGTPKTESVPVGPAGS